MSLAARARRLSGPLGAAGRIATRRVPLGGGVVLAEAPAQARGVPLVRLVHALHRLVLHLTRTRCGTARDGIWVRGIVSIGMYNCEYFWGPRSSS